MYKAVKIVKALDDYRLYLVFENEEEKIFDVKPYLHLGIFKELKNIEMFNTVKISFDSIEWDNQADLDPEFLYDESKPYKN
ncbi:MAG: DUF2442 domain-containing protein [Fusobacteriaceae bacterium]|nr:DUF2442 domain-containing protein [Fusobacteriaceae bacterium]MBP6467505.1 DUF2442 domain-containing protein [Fusobacteriaceae bacterium]MBU9918772.1 DUF2442 domain-containing protein [Fusobacteriaceae bacterium]